MNYQEAVTTAAQALQRGEDANWELARLTYENTNRRGGGKERTVSHEQWAADVHASSGCRVAEDGGTCDPKHRDGCGGRRFSARTSWRYAMMWDRYGQTAKSGSLSWTEAYYDMVPRDSGEQMRARQADIHLKDAPPERKREILTRLVNDPDVMADAEATYEVVKQSMAQPEVAERVVRDPVVRGNVARAQEQVRRDDESRVNHIRDTDPVVQKMDSMSASIDLEEACRKFANAIAEILPQMGEMPGDRILHHSVDRALDASDALRTFRDTGKTDIDAFVESVLRKDG